MESALASRPAPDSLLASLEAPPYHRVRLGETNRFTGIVLDPSGGVVRAVRVERDGRGAGEFPADLPSEEIGRHLPSLPAASRCRFSCEVDLAPANRLLRFTALSSEGGERMLFDYDLSFVGDHQERLSALARAVDALPVPSGQLVLLTQGHEDVGGYRDSIVSGLLHAQRCLEAAGVAPESVRSLLDFGCGTGRLLAGWHADSPHRELFGCDVHPELIGWAQHNLPAAVRFERSALAPPLDYPTGRFDLVLAVSVFTHFSAKAQMLWAQEIRRVVKPGGTLLATFHGEPYVRLFALSRLAEFEQTGSLESAGGLEGSTAFAAYHAPQAVERLFHGFRVRGFFPSGAVNGQSLFPIAALQDVYVLEAER